MIREASELASVCDELFSPDFENTWNQVRSSNIATEKPGLAKLADIFLMAGFSDAHEKLKPEWNAIAAQCGALLRVLSRLPSKDLVDDAAATLAELIYTSFAAGGKRRFRQTEIVQSRKARAAKSRKVKQRSEILRQAILFVCHRERLIPVASAKFATSIRVDVIEAAKEIGLSDSAGGTSARSIQRHIATLLKDPRM